MNVAVVGGSLTGLAAANVFHRLGVSVTVFERFARPLHDRGSSLGFVDVQLWEYIRGQRMTRMGVQAHRSQGAYYYGDLWKFLYEGLPEGCVRFNQVIHDLGVDPMKPTIHDQVYDAVIVADGGFSSLRKFVTGDDKQPEYAGPFSFHPIIIQMTSVDELSYSDSLLDDAESEINQYSINLTGLLRSSTPSLHRVHHLSGEIGTRRFSR